MDASNSRGMIAFYWRCDGISFTRRLNCEKMPTFGDPCQNGNIYTGRYTVCINNERRRTRHVSGTLCGIVESSVRAYPSNDSHISATCICGLQYLLHCTQSGSTYHSAEPYNRRIDRDNASTAIYSSREMRVITFFILTIS